MPRLIEINARGFCILLCLIGVALTPVTTSGIECELRDAEAVGAPKTIVLREAVQFARHRTPFIDTAPSRAMKDTDRLARSGTAGQVVHEHMHTHHLRNRFNGIGAPLLH